MTVKTKRVVKKVAKHSAWAISDIVFLILKTMGTVVLVAVTTGVVFVCIFLIYLRMNLTDGYDISAFDFKPNLSSVIYYTDSNGNERELVTIQSREFRRWVDYEEVPEHLINALVAIEDHRFFSHQGVDWYRTTGAFFNMFLGMRNTFGGSTITQQLIKNLTTDDDTTVQRKLQEIFRALEYEKQNSKEEILEDYLNLVYFGHGCHGIGAAAHYYFNKEVSDLTLAESAAIIAITNNPSQFSPYTNKEANKERQVDILWRMFELGYIETEQEYRRLLNTPLNFQRGEDEVYVQEIYTWFEEAIIKDVIQDLQNKLGYSETVARRTLYTGGLKIYATINMEMQDIVDNVYQNREGLPTVTGSTQPLQSGIIVADPFTGDILALSGGIGIKTKNLLLNRATTTRRPPGSALKPISVYAPAMDSGWLDPNTKFLDSPDVVLSGTNWLPRNSNRRYSGIVTTRSAIRNSLNTTPAIVLDQLSPATSYRFMRDALGFKLHPSDEDYAPLAAGQLTYGATVREMASAFTMFPGMGNRAELRTYSLIKKPDGSILLDNKPSHITVIRPPTAYWMTDMLHEAVTRGTGTAANLGSSMPTAGKTGTSTDNRDRWFVGFTPYYIAAVWTGFDTPAAMTSSANPAAQIWKMVMGPIHEGLEAIPFTHPGDVYLPPVPGIPTSYYTTRCVDVNGAVLGEESAEWVIGRNISVSAPAIDGYNLIGDQNRSILMYTEPGRNTVVFVYEPVIPEVPDPPDETDEVEDPDDPGLENPDNSGDEEEDFEEEFGTDHETPAATTPSPSTSPDGEGDG